MFSLLRHCALAALLLSPTFHAAAANTADTEAPIPTKSAPLCGFNQNWSMLPPLTPALLGNIKALAPQILRYPGGTITHDWDWRSGKRVSRTTRETAHPLAEVKTVADATGAQFVFVLDVAHSSLDDQLEMLRELRRLGLPIDYLELGNELYAKDLDYEKTFPDGAAYAATVNAWTPRLRAEFPGAKIAALLLTRATGAKNARLARWNAQVTAALKVPVDAYTLHVYIAQSAEAASTLAQFHRVADSPALAGKPLWITEYGNQNPNTDADYLVQLELLADGLEQHPRVAMVLNHQLLGPRFKTKFSPDGSSLTAEGELYRRRGLAGRASGTDVSQ